MRALAAIVLVSASVASANLAPSPPQQPKRAELPWITDDWSAALKESQRTGHPIFIDAWASWCHTCKSMQATALRDPLILALAPRFVWLAVDVERAANTAFLDKFPVGGLPTFLIVDGRTMTISARWLGAMTAPELKEFLRAAEANTEDPSTQLLLRAHEQYAKRRAPVDEYRQLLRKTPKEWPRRIEAVVAHLDALAKSTAKVDTDECIALIADELPIFTTARTSAAVDVASYAMSCMDKLPPSDPRIPPLRHALSVHLSKLIDDKAAPLSTDDRGEALALYAQLADKMQNPLAVRKAHERRRDLLAAAAGEQKDPEKQATYDWARAESLLALGDGKAAVALFTAREKELPGDYNPPYRLARIYLELKQPQEALTAADRALGKAYGPRKAQILGLRADALAALGKQAEALDAAKNVLAYIDALPPAQQKLRDRDAATERLKRLQTGAGARK